MSEKTLTNVRIVHKHDIEENWLKATNFIPKQGELIIYDVDDKYNYERMKIGDGISLVNDLPFGSPDSVILYTEQELTEEQQMQARKNQSLYYQESIYLGTIENVTFTDGLSQALEIPFLGINGNGNTGEANIQIDFISEDSKILRSFKGPYTWYNISNIGVTVHEYTGISDNGFSLRLYNEEVLEYIPGSGQDNNLTTTLKFYQLNIKQVEEEFIPNAIARTKDVPELTSSFDNILNYNSFAADAKAVGEALNLKADISLVTDVESALYNAIVENDIEDKAYVDEKIDAIPQANWNQNDETASDYIQGRTHYKTNVYKNVLDIIPIEIERTTALSSGKYRANLPVPSNSASNNYPNTNNILYCIVYNDVEYYRHAYSNNGNNYLGNMNIYNPALTDTGEPFYIMLEAYDAVYLYTRQAETFTIKIYEVEESTQYVQLDEKFIPDIIARKEYITEALNLKADKTDLDALEDLVGTTSVQSQISSAIAELVDTAPDTLDTLGELATAIQENDSVIDTLDAAITNKADKTEVEALKTQVTATSLILADAITGQKYEIQIQNGQLVSFPVEE